MSFGAHALVDLVGRSVHVRDVLTTWGVVLELDGIVDEETPESASHWFAPGRQAFFEQFRAWPHSWARRRQSFG